VLTPLGSEFTHKEFTPPRGRELGFLSPEASPRSNGFFGEVSPPHQIAKFGGPVLAFSLLTPEFLGGNTSPVVGIDFPRAVLSPAGTFSSHGNADPF